MKEKEGKVFRVMQVVGIATKHHVADYLAYEGDYSKGVSSVNNSKKLLDNLVDLERLEKINGIYRIKGNKSEGGEHALSLTSTLIQFLKLPYETTIIREKKIPINLIPDALIFMKNGDVGAMIILECVRNETEMYLKGKRNCWKNWSEAKAFLSQTFGYRIKSFEFVVQREGDKSWERF